MHNLIVYTIIVFLIAAIIYFAYELKTKKINISEFLDGIALICAMFLLLFYFLTHDRIWSILFIIGIIVASIIRIKRRKIKSN